MIIEFEMFEADMNIPKVGDYVICDVGNEATYFINFISNNIGKLVNITGGIEKNNIAHVTINYDREYNPIMCSNADELFEIYDNIEKYNTAYKLGLL